MLELFILEKKVIKKIFFISLAVISIKIFAQEPNNLFLYIPYDDEMYDYQRIYSNLKAWDNNEIIIDDDSLSAMFNNYIGKKTLQSLLVESFFRYTKNNNIQNRILDYINKNRLETSFTESLRKLYAAVPITVTRQASGKNIIQYNYNNLFFDENINLFLFTEAGFFNNELIFPLFINEWDGRQLTDPNASGNYESFFILCGGRTNAMTISFSKHSNLDEKDLEIVYRLEYYKNLYGDKWIINELPLTAILSKAGADRVIVGHGRGTDKTNEEIDTAGFNIYLYNRQRRIVYEVNYYINISPQNIHYNERERIYNFLFFQLLFIFLK